MMTNVSGEQGIDAALNLTTSGSSTGFRFSKWTLKMGWKGAKLGWSKHKGAKDKQLEMMSDACSAYRGGHVHKGNSEELSSLVRELGGNDATKLTGNEIFLGDRTDLSLFWKKTSSNKPVTISRAKLEGIEDADLRGRVISTFTKAQLDGHVAYDGNAYALTSKGREAILNPDFVLARIRGECKLFADANTQLQKDAAQTVNDRIDARLSELGMDGKFDGCDRITLNKERLFRGNVGEASSFHVPGTARRMSVEIPNANIIELDSNTYAAFLEKGTSYKNIRDGKQGMIGESDLFRYFDNKNKLDPKELATMVDKAEVAAKAEMMPTRSFATDDFFEAALRRSYEGSDVFAGEKLDADFVPKKGDVYSVFLGEEGSQDFTVTRAWQDELGGRNYNLSAVDGKSGDILLPEEAFGEVAFANKSEGEAYALANPEKAAEYRELFSDQLGETVLDATPEISTYTIQRGEWTTSGDAYNVSAKGRDYVSARIPAADAAPNPDGSLTVDVYSNKSYDVSTGKNAAYDVKQSGKALGKVLGKSAQASKEAAQTAKNTTQAATKAGQTAAKATAQAAKATAQGLKTAANGIESAAKATDAVATTTTKTVETAAAVIPPVEAITATVKVVLDASAKTAKVAAKTATTAAKAGAKGIKAGAKGVEAASKAHSASQKM